MAPNVAVLLCGFGNGHDTMVVKKGKSNLVEQTNVPVELEDWSLLAKDCYPKPRFITS